MTYIYPQSGGFIVEDENGQGNQLNQFNKSTYLFVDEDHSVYVSDYYNYRVMKYLKGAKEGIVVAGGQGNENSLTQLSYPQRVIVDHLEGHVIIGENEDGQQPKQLSFPRDLSFDRQGNLYVTDQENHQIQKFFIDSK